MKDFCNNGNLTLSAGQLDFMFNIIDSNGNGEICFDEFLRFVLLIMSPEDETTNAHTIFKGFDKDKNGSISKEELFQACRELEITTSLDKMEKIFNHIDKNGNGELDFSEFFNFYQILKKVA